MSKSLRLPVEPAFLFGVSSTLIALAFFLWTLRRPPREEVAEVALPADVVAFARGANLLRERGSETAPDTLTEVSDLMCSACASIEFRHGALVDSLVRAGRLFHRVVDMPMQPGSPLVTAFSACAYRTAIKHDYWRARRMLFEAQDLLRSAYPVEAALLAVATTSAVDTSGMRACLEGEMLPMASKRRELGRLASVAGLQVTPTFWIGGSFVRADRTLEAVENLANESRR